MPDTADRHMERVIRRTIWMAELGGQDYATQDRIAVRTLRCMRPEMTVSEALAVVRRVRSGSAEAASWQIAEDV